jgi:hypothetical protein
MSIGGELSATPRGFMVVLTRLGPLAIVVVFVALGLRLTSPPAAVPATADAAVFSAARAFTHVIAIADVPHPMGSAAIENVRRYITGELEDLGLEVQPQTTFAPDYYGAQITVPVVNLVARIPGSATTGAVALMAHYDTVPQTSGANDNTIAVAALLETARALTTGPALGNDILLLFTDAEEPAPRYGSRRFIADNPAFSEIALIVNFETNGRTGASVLVETNGPQRWLIDQLAAADYHPAAFSSLTETATLLGDIGTDFDQFRNAGTPGFHFAYIHGSSVYHTAADNIASVDHGSLQAQGDYALGIARHFGNMDLTNLPDTGDSVFFSLGFVLIHYPETWTIPLMIVAVLGLGVGLRRLLPAQGDHHPWRVLSVTVGALLVGTLAWVEVPAGRSSLGATEGYIYYALILAVAALAVARASGRRGGGRGALVCLLLLTVLTAVYGRGFSYLFVWPTVAAAIAIWWPDRTGWSQHLRFALVALVTLLLLVPAVDLFIQFAHPRPGNPDSSIPSAIIVPLGLGLLATRVLAAFWPDATDQLYSTTSKPIVA